MKLLRAMVVLQFQPFAVPEGTGHPTYDQMSAQTRALADRFDAAFAPHFSDLARAHPFHWAIEFPEAFFDADGAPLDNPGFTIVIGNPPWEILSPTCASSMPSSTRTSRAS
ncbi:MAG: hypothetical protein M5U07_02205 [Xanthobacteraceae bacterium]|nr:hypothetical protein [Xanthobacteraceae bacterium]